MESKKGNSKPTEISSLANAALESNLLEINKTLRDQIQQEHERFTELRENYERLENENEQLLKEQKILVEKSDAPSRRILKLPAELALSSIHGYSSLVDQLVECMMDLKEKEKEIQQNKVSLESSKVVYKFILNLILIQL